MTQQRFRWYGRFRKTIRFLSLFLLISALFAAQGQAAAKAPAPSGLDTRAIFERYADRIVKVQVVESKSGAESIIGTGFFVSQKGHLITNYHVVSKYIQFPERYKVQVLGRTGEPRDAVILGIDVLSDLAVLKDSVPADAYFSLTAADLPQGTHLFSLGHPRNISLSIVEGTHNGYFKQSSLKQIHFTGSLNPGMSGGPAITASGVVAGINVTTAGNQVGFLVPVSKAVDLLSKTRLNGNTTSPDFTEAVRSQVLKFQESTVPDDLIKSGKTVRLGNYDLPGQLSTLFECNADSYVEPHKLYETVTHACSNKEDIYISNSLRTGSIKIQHQLITTDKLNQYRFYNLYSEFFKSYGGPWSGSEEELTKYECRAGTVEHNGAIFKTLFCARAYKKLPGVYDVAFKAAALGDRKQGLVTSLYLTGVSFEKGMLLSRDYLEKISWKK